MDLKRVTINDQPFYNELVRHFIAEKNPAQSTFRSAVWRQIQAGDEGIVFVRVRQTSVLDDQYGQSSMP